MDKKDLQQLLEQVAQGSVKPEEALLQIKVEPYKDLGFAKVDTHRGIRQGMAEVIYGAGKTKEQILKIAQTMVLDQEKDGPDHQDEPGSGRLCRKRTGSPL